MKTKYIAPFLLGFSLGGLGYFIGGLFGWVLGLILGCAFCLYDSELKNEIKKLKSK